MTWSVIRLYRPRIKKLSNRNRILECVFHCIPITRTDVAENADITPATVTLTVNRLITDDMVRELEEADSGEGSSGRKRILIDMVPGYVYSIDVGSTQKTLATCITDLKGTCICQSERPFDKPLSPHIAGEIIEQIRSLLDSCQLPPERTIGTGVAVPDHMSEESRHFISNHTVWQSFDSSTIHRVFPYLVVIENNARYMALAQYLLSPGSSPKNFSFFHIGLGMFCADMTDGELFLGNNYIPGGIGHTTVKADGQLYEYGKYGCLQTVASERWLLKYARLFYQNTADTILHNTVDTPEELAVQHITTTYSMGDAAIGRYITDTLEYLDISISNMAIPMNPSKIFFHGQLFQNKDIHRELVNIIERQLLFVDSKYVNNAGILPYRQTDGAVGANTLSVFHDLI